MKRLPDNTDSALVLHEKGYIPVPMIPGTKIPAVKGWNDLTHDSLTREDIIGKWREQLYGIAVLTRGFVVLDVEADGDLQAVLEKCGLANAPVCRTPSGGAHVHARIRAGVQRARKIKLLGQPLDFLTGDSLSIVPPTPGYEWLSEGLPAVSQLPLAKVAWTREQKRRRVYETVSDLPESRSAVKNPEAYVLRIRSVQGENGSAALVRAICILRDAGRSADHIFAYIMGTWNPACAEPEWSGREVQHAIERHCR